MTICTNCNGEGLVGQGDQPWLKQGHIQTCGKCDGTGQVDVNAGAAPQEEVPAAEESTQEESTTVDNADSPKVDGSTDGNEPGDSANQSSEPALG